MTPYNDVKERGWYNIITDPKTDLTDYSQLSDSWQCCALGEILNFPPLSHACEVKDELPEIEKLGIEFHDHITSNDHDRALETFEKIHKYEDEINWAYEQVQVNSFHWD